MEINNPQMNLTTVKNDDSECNKAAEAGCQFVQKNICTTLSEDMSTSIANIPSTETDMELNLRIGNEKFAEISSQLEDEKNSACLSSSLLMSRNCSILSSTISCLWLNWDSPVEGVSDYVVNIFQSLMKILSVSISKGLSEFKELSWNLMNQVMSMAWHSKTRYRPMSILISYLNSKSVLTYFPRLKDELLKCMSKNHMSAVATDVYKTFLQKMITECEISGVDPLSVWDETWMNLIVLGLISSDNLQRLKVCTYWLPPTLKVIPGSNHLLVDTISKKYDEEKHSLKKAKYLFAWVTVFKSGRDILGTGLLMSHERFLAVAITSFDESIRSEILMLICSTHKRAEVVSSLEIKWLKAFLPVNLRTDSAIFRQNMGSSFKKIIVRIRDSCVSALQRKRMAENSFSSGIEFIDWSYKLLIFNLAPGGSYQRRQTTLNLLEILLESLIYRSSDFSKKGKVPENSNLLLKHAQEMGMWDFFSNSSFFSLLTCLEDGAEEIQTQGFKILMEFFQWPSSLSMNDGSEDDVIHQHVFLRGMRCASPSFEVDSHTLCHLFSKSLLFLSSPKCYENNSGILIMKLILNKFITVFRVKFVLPVEEFDISVRHLKCSLDKLDASCDEQDAAFQLINLLLEIVQKSFITVKSNVAMHFKMHTLHGITECISKCLLEFFKSFDGDCSSKWMKLLEDFTLLNEEILLLALDVLAGGKSVEECPSFADMGMALEEFVSINSEDQEDIPTLSPAFQFLLSWCWINLKNSCTCLGDISSYTVRKDKCILPCSFIHVIRSLFVKVLTTCRHRGAIEGCRSGFFRFCSSLLSSSVKELSNIPKVILEDVLQSLSSNSLTASVSRRSAGLPIIIQTIVSSAIKVLADRECLLFTVERLYFIAAEPLPTDHDQQRDLAQCHALNILKALFCDASLSSFLLPHLAKITIIVIDSFDSPSWAIRNAATQLISTLMMRIFGQRNLEQGSMTLEEFNGAFPLLYDYAIKRLQVFHTSRSVINPSLYLILTLFSNLTMSPSSQQQSEAMDGENIRESLQKITLSFSLSPLYSLRKLSARAYANLCLCEQADDHAKTISNKLVDGRPSTLNVQHGYLLCLHYLISSGFVRYFIFFHISFFMK